ncbi:MAG: AAA family ATPase [Minisyncoccia bacterium]
MSGPTTSPNAPKEVLEEVSREYEQILVIPDHIQSPQWMLMPVGMIGAGKTTVVKPLAEHFGLIRISTDEIRERLKLRGYGYEGAREISNALAQKYLSRGYSLAIDANTGSQFGIEHNKKNREMFPHVRYVFIHINPPEEYIINKLKNYTHTWLFADGEHAVENFRTHKEKYVLPDVPFAYTFDPSRDDLPEQLKEGIRAIENALRTA